MATKKVRETLLRKKKNPVEWKWCSYCQMYHKRDVFYRNSSTVDGLANECKLASKAKYDYIVFSKLYNSLTYRQKQMYGTV